MGRVRVRVRVGVGVRVRVRVRVRARVKVRVRVRVGSACRVCARVVRACAVPHTMMTVATVELTSDMLIHTWLGLG